MDRTVENVYLPEGNIPGAAFDRRRDKHVATTVGPAATGVAWAGKRVLDIAVSLVLLVLLAPLFVALAVAVLLSSPGGVLFRQERVGRGGRRFVMLKFRTMTTGSEEVLAATPALLGQFSTDFKIPNRSDPRVTRLGRSLRQSSLDELPQLINVLKGDMSLVGPRPVQPAQLAAYGDHQGAYMDLRPGLTGLWQISGRNAIHFPERAEIDADYRRRCGPALDLRILAATPIAVLTKRGVV